MKGMYDQLNFSEGRDVLTNQNEFHNGFGLLRKGSFDYTSTIYNDTNRYDNSGSITKIRRFG